MGNFAAKSVEIKTKKGKPKKVKEAGNFFDHQKQLQYERERENQMKLEMATNSGGRKVQSERNVNVDMQESIRGAQADSVRPVRPPKQQMVSYDQEMIERMKHQLRADANAFLLNNIMLSVQFFDNYERVMWDLKNNSVTESDRMLNDNMAQHHKHIFLPDKLQEEVHAHVRVRMPNAEDKLGRKCLEGLQPQRMFVIHDNVEVNEPGEVPDYSTVLDAPYYRMIMEEDDEPGFVRIKKLEILQNKMNSDENLDSQPKKQKYSSSESDLSDDSDTKMKEELTEGKNFMNELKEQIDKKPKQVFKTPNKLISNTEYQTNKSRATPIKKLKEQDIITSERRPSGILKNRNRAVMHGKLASPTTRPRKRQKPNNKKTSPSGSESSGYKTSHSPATESSGESDYGYAKITAETTPKKLKASEAAKISDSTSIIPLRCITVVEVKKQPDDSDDDDEIEEAYKARYGAQNHRDLYKKMYYLNSNLFMGNFTDIFLLRLAQSLGFTGDSVEDALTQGASIYCTRGVNKAASFEVLPSLNANWPNVAQGWVVRRRNIIKNPRTSYVYHWPTQHMVGKAKSLGCLIVPLGFRPSRGTNKDMSLQWRLTFPAIERYLETCLAHSHVRCHLFATLLFKMFIIKNENSKVGLDYNHIRNHLFWQCEDNYAMWPEDRLGETLRIFLKSFYQQMMKANMPDYFIPQCNLFKGIPKAKLLKQQRILADIIESPVMHLLSALKNLKYVKNNFYPVFNYKKLYKILTCEDILSYVNPHLARTENKYEDDSDEEHHTDKGFWNEIKQKDPGYKWRKEQLRQQEAKRAAEAIINNAKIAKEAVEKKKILPSYMDPHRRRLVLELFIEHFMIMAEYSEKFHAMRQGIIYLEHAYRLSVVLRDEPGGEPQGREFIAIIREKIDILKSKVATSGPPKVPKRNDSINSTTMRPSISGVIQKKPEQYINLENVQNESHVKDQLSPTTKLTSIETVDVQIQSESEKPKSIKAVTFQTVDEESGDDDRDSDEGSFMSRL